MSQLTGVRYAPANRFSRTYALARPVLHPGDMEENAIVGAASRIAELAVELGWTPPGWRGAHSPSRWPRVFDHLDEVARAAAALADSDRLRAARQLVAGH